ncbi:hypothetical protein I3843_03G122300 [Carya illinoinensis]|uniref:Uncharacterized protein n=1 Tax=Carya illinoinensis TaxID=32201 RepID=A0A922FL89_CARIL|nr:hypothetical protein I3842_03G122500 [Carya illinoinensis]KAG7987208.1 hypothetical protein I3843_03G122300 [Carya illinoinensis]
MQHSTHAAGRHSDRKNITWTHSHSNMQSFGHMHGTNLNVQQFHSDSTQQLLSHQLTHAHMQHTWDPLTQSAFGQQELQSHDATMTADHSHSVGQHVIADGLIRITYTHEKCKHIWTQQTTHMQITRKLLQQRKRNSHMHDSRNIHTPTHSDHAVDSHQLTRRKEQNHAHAAADSISFFLSFKLDSRR